LTVLDVINAVDPFKRIEQCPLGLESHSGNLCPLHKRLDEAAAYVERSFAATTISELLGQPHRSTPFCENSEE
jgi:DNA-binding IscR family transcriptional regulator